MNRDGEESIEAFLAEWARATSDRTYKPGWGESSARVGERFNSLLALPLLTSSAQIRVTNTGSRGTWEIDDAFIDPCLSRLG